MNMKQVAQGIDVHVLSETCCPDLKDCKLPIVVRGTRVAAPKGTKGKKGTK